MLVASPITVHRHRIDLLGCLVTELSLVGGMFTLPYKSKIFLWICQFMNA